MALDQTMANSILTFMHGGAAPTVLSGGNKMSLETDATVPNATTAGTEVATGGGYTSGTGGRITLSWAAASGGSQATNAVAQVTNYPRAENVKYVGIYEGGGSFRRIEWGALTAMKTMASGDTLSFASGAITSALA